MTKKQKYVLFTLLVFAFLYFILLIFPNNQGADDAHLLSITSQDEGFQYPFLLRMLTPGSTVAETLKHIISYHHYIYGYPFYVYSALVSLPLSLIYGEALVGHTQLHLLVLRQFVSVLPMLASIILMVYLQTRFRSPWRSLVLFVILASIPGIVRQNITWWHPDAMAIFFAMLVFFFLDRDNLQFKRNFYFAAIACGLSAGVKLIGFLFFLVIAVYLLIGILQKKISIKKAVTTGFLFILILAATLVITNPLLLISETRADILKTHFSHTESFRTGWENDDSYNRNPLTWLPVLERWYGGIVFLAFALVSLIAGVLRGERKLLNALILLWVIPYSLYLLLTIAVRPDHYWMPVMLPLFSAVLNLVHPDDARPILSGKFDHFSFSTGVALLALLAALGQLVLNLQKSVPLYQRALNQQKLLLACDLNPINQLDGISVPTQEKTWYAVEEFNLHTEPPLRKYYAVSGEQLESVRASNDQGIQAWACRSSELAVFRSTQFAMDFKHSYPDFQVIGPDGQAIER